MTNPPSSSTTIKRARSGVEIIEAQHPSVCSHALVAWAGRRLTSGPLLPPHGHQHVERTLGVPVLDQRWGAGICKLPHRGFAFEVPRDVEQIKGIDAGIQRSGPPLPL